jgi:bacterioferritin (cytochrome b1)
MPEVEKDPLERDETLEKLNSALELTTRDAVAYTLAAGSVVGLEALHLGVELSSFAASELDEARRLAEKIVALGGQPSAAVPNVPYESGAKASLSRLIKAGEETLAALADVIQHTGNEAEGEALEHLLEHAILRKQNQVDFLRRAVG